MRSLEMPLIRNTVDWGVDPGIPEQGEVWFGGTMRTLTVELFQHIHLHLKAPPAAGTARGVRSILITSLKAGPLGAGTRLLDRITH